METIRSLMVTETVAVTPTDTVLEAARLMRQNRTGAVLVIDEGELLGLFSERDLMTRVVAERRDPGNTLVGQVCTATLATIDVDEPLSRVTDIFRRRRFRHLPVLDRGKPLGIVSSRDCLARVVEDAECFRAPTQSPPELVEGVAAYDDSRRLVRALLSAHLK